MATATPILANPLSVPLKPISCSVCSRASWKLNGLLMFGSVLYVLLAYSSQLRVLDSQKREVTLQPFTVSSLAFWGVFLGLSIFTWRQDYRERRKLQYLTPHIRTLFETSQAFSTTAFPRFTAVLSFLTIAQFFFAPFTTTVPVFLEVFDSLIFPGITILSSVCLFHALVWPAILIQPERLVITDLGILWEQAYTTSFVPWESLKKVIHRKKGNRYAFVMICQPRISYQVLRFNFPTLATGEHEQLLKMLELYVPVTRK